MTKRHALCAISLLILLLSALLVGCSQWELPFEGLDEDGYTVSVTYDPCGGAFSGTENVIVSDAFKLSSLEKDSDGAAIISLIAPDDERRGKENAFSVSKNGCFLAGWYTECSPRTDENGEALDSYGLPVSETGRPQGYIYFGRWDFENDTIKLDAQKSYTSGESVMTLYAAWIPYFSFEFYAKDASGNFALYESAELMTLTLPAWEDGAVQISMNGFPELDGKTFVSAYSDEACSNALDGEITGEVDYERGISSTSVIRIYADYKDGDWYRISSAEQFVKNSRLGACYEIVADLDFSGQIWSAALSGGAFTGKIIGNGHKFSNISFIQTNNSITSGGLFGTLAAGCVIENISFENASYTMSAGSRMQGSSFGLLCGTLSPDASVSGASVSGTFEVGADIYPQAYSLGLLSGNCENGGIDLSAIALRAGDGAEDKLTLSHDPQSGEITLTFKN